MRTIARRILTGLSAALFVACAVEWVRSQWASDVFALTRFEPASADIRRVTVSLTGTRSRALFSRNVEVIRVASPERLEVVRADLASDPVLAHYAGAPVTPDKPTGGWGGGGFYASTYQSPPPHPSISVFTLVHGRAYPLTYQMASLSLPWWFLTSAFAILPLRAVRRWLAPRARPIHACPTCGYDLRATPSAEGPLLPTCPECGRTAKSA